MNISSQFFGLILACSTSTIILLSSNTLAVEAFCFEGPFLGVSQTVTAEVSTSTIEYWLLGTQSNIGVFADQNGTHLATQPRTSPKPWRTFVIIHTWLIELPSGTGPQVQVVGTGLFWNFFNESEEECISALHTFVP